MTDYVFVQITHTVMRYYANLDSDIYRLDDNVGAAGWNNRELPTMNENNRQRSKRHRESAGREMASPRGSLTS